LFNLVEERSMTQFGRPGTTVEHPDHKKPASSRLADLGDRLAKAFAPIERPERPERPRPVAPPWEAGTEVHVSAAEAGEEMWEDVAPAFPIVRSGYDRDAVDDYVNELEREIDELRAKASSDGAVSTEIKKIGEQTAAILQVAHQQAHETTAKARAEADRCLQDAAANAVAMTEEAKRKLRHLDSETDSVWHERMRLLDDVRGTAAALVSLADDAARRFPSEDERRAGHQPAAVASAPSPVTAPVDEPGSGAEASGPVAGASGSVADGDDHVGGLDDRADSRPFFQS
jgi:cell division septum initiation protein DivIVA